jgi:hypothetical protein
MWEYRARLSDKIRAEGDDGDTVLMLLDLGMDVRTEQSIRLSGVWAPELHQPHGLEVAAFTRLTLEEVEERHTARRSRWPFVVKTEPNATAERGERRSFTRYVGAVFAADTRECLNYTIAEFLASHPEWDRGTGG